MASTSTEARELELVGKVELRIALAKDDKLESVLRVYLPPLLLKLSSDHVTVRNKVISTCQHIKIRLAGNQDIVLPVAALLKQYKENAESTMIRHFDLLFIQQSVGKLSPANQLDLLPLLLHDIAKDAGKPTCATVFNLFLRLLPRLRLPLRGSKEDTDLRTKLGLDEHVDDAKFVASWFGKLVLFSLSPPQSRQLDLPPGPGGSALSPARSLPAGLSADDCSFLTSNGKAEAWNPNSPEGMNLTETKITVLSFLASGAFVDGERFIPALFAAADTNSRISSIGDDLLKRTTVSLEDRELIRNLFEVHEISKPAVQIRILTLFSKSTAATTFPEKIFNILQKMRSGNVQGATSSTDSGQIQGLEAVKMRNALFNFMNWVSRIASKKDLEQVAPSIIHFLRAYIEDQGWPVPNNRNSDEVSLRALAYETLGSMAKTVPREVVEPDLALVRWLFRSLTEERSSDTIFISIEGALASLLGAFAPPLDTSVRNSLRLLLLDYMTLEENETIVRSARYVAVRWASRCLDYKDIVGKWIDVLAVGGRPDERSDVVEEGKKGLDPYWSRLVNSSSSSVLFSLPDWGELVKVFFTGHSLLESSNFANSMRSGMEVDGISVFGNFAGPKMNAFAPAISYCRRLIVLQALETTEAPITDNADWERQLDVLLRTDKVSRQKVRDYMKSIPQDSLAIFFSAAFEGMLWDFGNGLQDCGKSFVELASLAPIASLAGVAARASELLPVLKTNNSANRIIGAQALGVLGPHPGSSTSNLMDTLQSLSSSITIWATAVGTESNKVHGSILGLGNLLSRTVLYGRLQDIDENLANGIVVQVLEILTNAKDASTKEAATVALGNMAMAGLVTAARTQRSSTKTSEIIQTLVSDAKKGNEKAITALGRFAMCLEETAETTDDDNLPALFKELFALHELRQAEVHFTVGEAIACASACWRSDSLLLNVDVETTFRGQGSRSSTLNDVVVKLLEDCKTTKPSLKKAAGIWLFCLIQYCGHQEEIQSRLRECQGAFMGLLSARDELVQETASRGLSLVYEQGDKDLKDRLVNDLVASFTGTSTKIQVEEETELFEPGALPTGDGQSVTSYKDIMSLAAEVGDQSLVYKFMSLASNAATWSTRAAFGRFGLSNILSESAVDPKLYPKLYRYRFDPNSNVQRSMNDIWNALVKDPNTVIDKYFDEIINDLLKSILGKEWRTRQASCAAIADLVQGRQFEKYEQYLSRIWEVAFKVLDDIKGSVRKAAESLCQVLTGILVRQLEAGASSKHAQAMLKEVMPFLFSTRGLESSAKDVQAFAYDTVLKLVKSGGKSLLPFIPSLIEQILGLLSTLEPEFINYIQINAAKYDTTEEKIDQARSNMISHSPMMEAIERCLDLLDEPTMNDLVPCLENVIKTAVGMPSKVGCSGVLVSLSTRHSFEFRPHADVILKDLEKAVLDRNSTVSAAYARAAGYVARLASDQQILRLLVYSKNLYFSAENETRRQISADIIFAISKFATDRFNSLASEFLPFVFLAKHDFDEHVKDQFQKTWEENVGGSRAVLLYLKEIIALSVERLESPKWTVKHTAALTIAEVITSAGTDMSLANAEIVWPALEKALALKTFDGKEKLLEAFVKFSKAAKVLWENNSTISAQMKKIAIREAKRNNEGYRPHAFLALGEYAETRGDIDMFTEVYDIIAPVLSSLTDADEMDTADDKTMTGTKDTATITAGQTALFLAIPTHLTHPTPLTHLPKLVALLPPILASPKASINTRTALYTSIKTLTTALCKRTHPEPQNNYPVASGLLSLLELPSGAGSELARTKRAEAAEGMVAALAAGVFGMSSEGRAAWKAGAREQLGLALANERSQTVRNILERAVKALGE